MGVESGLPDFRGPEGFWRAYPALGQRGLHFADIASPSTFETQPALAWGFYGHRLNLYRNTVPHQGFQILRGWGERMFNGYGVFTSNVDGQFEKAGFDPALLAECHGSIHYLQCSRPCSQTLWPANEFTPRVDAEHCLLENAPPRCPRCSALARPNIMMFGDPAWVEGRSNRQVAALKHWLDGADRIVAVEVGAGTAIPSVRHFTHMLTIDHGARLVRINPREARVPTSRDVSLAAPALASLQAIDLELRRRRSAIGHPILRNRAGSPQR